MPKIRSVLIIDDNEDDIELTRHYLERSGCFEHIFAVRDGQQALELFRDYENSRRQFPDAFPPIIVLLDINMPKMDGFAFLEGFVALERAPDDPAIIVMLTSSAFQHDLERAKSYDPVKDYVVKPITAEQAAALAERYGE